jgi:4-aminobutyrate aminotransferase
MPHPSLDSFFFWNSGSEAVEAAMKLARKATGRTNLITFQGAYHGRTYGSGAMTRSKTIYTQGTGPLLVCPLPFINMNGSLYQGSIYCTAYPYWHSLGVQQGTSEEEIVRMASFQLDMTLRQQVNPNEVAAIIIEPVQGEGGYVPCPPAFLKHLRTVCDKHGIMLIVDEVQTGFMRTGKYFSVDHIEGFKPDALIMAKGLANGFPLSGLVTRKELSDKLEPGSFGGTYAGNAVACAAGIAAQEVFQTEDIEGNVVRRSEQLYAALNKLAESPKTKHLIAEVRGQGVSPISFHSLLNLLE